MSENWLTWYISGATGIVGVLASHLGMLVLAEQTSDAVLVEYIDYQKLWPTLRQLQKDVDIESWCWPIYTRPVFYTPIDHDAQILFSNVQRNLNRAIDLEKNTPPPPEGARSLRHLIALSYNWQRYNICLEIQQNISEFRNTLSQISTQLTMLRQSHNRETILQEETKRNLEALEKQLEEAGKKLPQRSKGKKFDENLNWVQTKTKNCFLEAQNQLKQETTDGINFAISDQFIGLTKDILEHFDLYEKEYAIPARFELDQFEKHHNPIQIWIEEILAEPIADWRALHKMASYREHVRRQLDRSRRSLDAFSGMQQVLQRLDQQVRSLDFPKRIGEVQHFEKECEKYWRPYDQDHSIWVKVLKSAQLPSVDLDDAHRSFRADILPATDTDALIRQSSMAKIIFDINLILRKFNNAQANKIRLQEELDIHKAAQLEVEIRLGATGSTCQRVKELAPIEPDTSPDIEHACISYRKDFDVFQARARKVQGASFPEMLVELNHFEDLCISAKQKHIMQLESLKRQGYDLVQQLINLQKEINGYIAKKPRIEYDVSNTSQKVALSISTYSNEIESYRELQSYISKTRTNIGIAIKERNQLKKLWQKFVVAQKETANKIAEMEKQLRAYQAESEKSWAWTQKAYRKTLKPALSSYERHTRELEQLTTLDITIKQAVGMCNQLREEVDGELRAVTSKLEPIREQQEHYANWHKELLDSTKRVTMFTITPKNSDLIKEFCARAEISENSEGAKLGLEMAQRMLEQSLPREEAMRIINNQGVYNENPNVGPGGTMKNAGRDLNQFGNQPSAG